MYKILIVEDDRKLSDLVSEFLSRYGYDVHTADDFRNIEGIFGNVNPDLLLLDVNLPYMDGYWLCRSIRRKSGIPVIIISVRGSDMEQIMGIESGADDYIVKPFNFEVLLAKVKSALRRAYGEYSASLPAVSAPAASPQAAAFARAASAQIAPASASSVPAASIRAASAPAAPAPASAPTAPVSAASTSAASASAPAPAGPDSRNGAGRLILDEASFKVCFGGHCAELTKNEFKLLKKLCDDKDIRITTREELLEELWDDAGFVDDNTLTVNVARVRSKLAAVGLPDALKTKRGVGYFLDIGSPE